MKRSRASRFLRDCANLKADPDTEAADAAYEKFQERYPEIFQTLESPEALLWIGAALGKVWEAASDHEREWYLYAAESIFRHETASSRFWPPPPPPEPSALEQVFLHFRRNLTRALICRNPKCSTPYFLARQKGQKYCSEKCSHLARNAAKLKWWDTYRRKTPRPEPSPSTQPTQPKSKKGKTRQ